MTITAAAGERRPANDDVVICPRRAHISISNRLALRDAAHGRTAGGQNPVRLTPGHEASSFPELASFHLKRNRPKSDTEPEAISIEYRGMIGTRILE